MPLHKKVQVKIWKSSDVKSRNYFICLLCGKNYISYFLRFERAKYFAIRNEILRDSSRTELIPPNIRDEILSESGLTRTPSRLEKKK